MLDFIPGKYCPLSFLFLHGESLGLPAVSPQSSFCVETTAGQAGNKWTVVLAWSWSNEEIFPAAFLLGLQMFKGTVVWDI